MNERVVGQRRVWRGLTGDRSKGTCDNKERTKSAPGKLRTAPSQVVKLAVSEGPCQWFFACRQGVGTTLGPPFRPGVSDYMACSWLLGEPWLCCSGCVGSAGQNQRGLAPWCEPV